MNENSILLIYEGYSESILYPKLIQQFVPQRKIQINYANLKGIYNINKKVKQKIEEYLRSPAHRNLKNIHVIICYDREGEIGKETDLNLDFLIRNFKTNDRVKEISEIIATQDLESWLFHDILGIYRFLKVPIKQQNIRTYSNVYMQNNRTLSSLFRKYGKVYMKRKGFQGFIEKLDLKKIHNSESELQKLVNYINSKIK